MQEDSKITDINYEHLVVMDSEVTFGKFDVDCSSIVCDTEQGNESADEAQLVIFDVSEAAWFKSCNCLPLEDLLRYCKSCHESCDMHKMIELPGDAICDSSQAGDGEAISNSLTSLSSPAVSIRTVGIDSDRFYPVSGEEKYGEKYSEEQKISEFAEEIATPISVFENDLKTKLKTSELEKEEFRSEPEAGTRRVSAEEMRSSVRFREPNVV